MDITRTRILLAALPAADWAQANPVLGLGEPAFETDTGFLRIGDGTSRFLELKVHGAYDEVTDAVAAATAAQTAAELARDEAADAANAAEAAQAAAEAGGADTILTHDFSTDPVTGAIEVTGLGLDKYDHVIISASNMGADGSRTTLLSVSVDDGATWETGVMHGGFVHSGSQNWGGPWDNMGFSASNANDHNLELHLYHDSENGRWTVQGWCHDGSNMRMQSGYIDADFNAVRFFTPGASGVTTNTGTLTVRGIKNGGVGDSVIQFSERAAGAWSAGSDVIAIPTMPVTIQSGAVGTVRVDADPGADVDVEVRDEADTVVAIGTITSGTRSADLTAAADATISEEIKLHVIDGPGSATRIDMVLRVVAS